MVPSHADIALLLHVVYRFSFIAVAAITPACVDPFDIMPCGLQFVQCWVS